MSAPTRIPQTALRELPQLKVHVALIDTGLHDTPAFDCTRRLKSIVPKLRVLILAKATALISRRRRRWVVAVKSTGLAPSTY